MGIAKKIKRKFTYRDYLTWGDDERWEIIGGEAYNMTPAPTVVHQNMAGVAYRQLSTQLAGKKCVAFMAPTDVVLSDEDVVQPDVFVICKKTQISETHIEGAPALVIEILSPSTAIKDKREKRTLYEHFGVREYILIDPGENYAERYVLEGGIFRSPEIFSKTETIKLKSLKGTKIGLKEIFESQRFARS